MNPKPTRDITLRELWLPHLVLPIGTAQPSLVALAVTASFLVAFSLTFTLLGGPAKLFLSPANSTATALTYASAV